MATSKEQIEQTTRRIAVQIDKAVKAAKTEHPEGPDIGFILLLFDFGSKGTASYMSNAQRQGAIDALEELLVRIRGS